MRKEMLTLGMVLSLATVGCTSGSDGSETCARDTDCKGARVCDQGVCADPPAACQAPADCGAGMQCRSGACVPEGAECALDSDCAAGETCEAGDCRPAQVAAYGWCCLNDTYYDCASKSAFDLCVGFDLDACMAACQPMDFDCMDACFAQAESATHDPSACARNPAKDGECAVSGTCLQGNACDYDSDCQTNNCANGSCWENDNGCPCEYDSDCDSQNCTDGQCQGNSAGSPCDYDSDCDTQNCVDGTCYGRGFGERCEYDSDCDSGACTSGTCS
jgi:hypothetical protein